MTGDEDRLTAAWAAGGRIDRSWPLVVAGLAVCALKGLRWGIIGLPADKATGHTRWGWWDARLDYVWAEQTTRPRGNRFHHLTDLIVEWNRLDPQRGAKLLSALAVLTFAFGVGLGWLL